MKRYLLTIIAVAVIRLPVVAVETDSETATAEKSQFKFSAIVDMQVEKNLYEEILSGKGTTRFPATHQSFGGYRYALDDFWMRASLKGLYRSKYLENAFALRYYPYWTMRRDYTSENSISGAGGADLSKYLEVWELTLAYIKVFKDYSPQENLTFRPHFKIGRDGLLSNCSQLFGNYLELPIGGFGDSRQPSIVGPFKNKKVFANQIEAGFAFNVFNMVGGATSLMIGGNVNNEKWYSKMAPTQFYQELDSRLSAGFLRLYQDLFFWDKRIHIGGGFRKYSAPVDSFQVALVPNTYFAAQGVFDAAIMKDVKFYTEMAMQKMSSEASTGIVRPINAGITFPTFGVLDTLALEFENVAKTFFSDQSMRDAVKGRQDTKALAWGIVVEKRYSERFVIDWGIFSGNPTGDMKTTLRLTGMLN